MSEKSSWWLVAVLVAAKMMLVGWWPYLADSQGDTAVFLQQSIHLLNGEWLGPYSASTLASGPVTPIWIALMHFLGVPLLLSLHALHVGACVLCMMAFKRLSDRRGFLVLVFGLLLFNPLTLDYAFAASAVHLSLEYSLALALLGVSLIAFLDLIGSGTTSKCTGILFCVLLFLYWNNDSGRFWVVIYLAVLVLFAYIWPLGKENRAGSPARFSAVVVVFMLPSALCLAGTAAIALKNYCEYGVFTVVAADQDAGVSVQDTAPKQDMVPNLSGLFHPVFAAQGIDSIEKHHSWAAPVYRLEISRLVNSPIRVDEGMAPYLPDYYLRTVKNKTRQLGKLTELLLATIPAMFWLCVAGVISGAWRPVRGGLRFSAPHLQLLCLAGAATLLLIMHRGSLETGRAEALYFSFQAVFYVLASTAALCLTRDVRRMYRAARR